MKADIVILVKLSIVDRYNLRHTCLLLVSLDRMTQFTKVSQYQQCSVLDKSVNFIAFYVSKKSSKLLMHSYAINLPSVFAHFLSRALGSLPPRGTLTVEITATPTRLAWYQATLLMRQ